MKVSVCITTLNEEKNIGRLLTALLNQTKKLMKLLSLMVVQLIKVPKSLDIFKKG